MSRKNPEDSMKIPSSAGIDRSKIQESISVTSEPAANHIETSCIVANSAMTKNTNAAAHKIISIKVPPFFIGPVFVPGNNNNPYGDIIPYTAAFYKYPAEAFIILTQLSFVYITGYIVVCSEDRPSLIMGEDRSGNDPAGSDMDIVDNIIVLVNRIQAYRYILFNDAVEYLFMGGGYLLYYFTFRS